MVDHEHVREVYVELLRLLYSKVHASVPLLAASSAALERSIHDQVAAGMGDWLHEHASEEQHHDEWLLEDYTTIGRDPAELGRQAGSRPSRSWSVRCTIGCCTLTRRHPRVLRGPGMEPAVRGIHRSARGRTGYPARAFYTLRQHSAVDVDHGAEVFDPLDRLPLCPERDALIGLTTLQTADLLIAAADELLEEVSGDIA